MSMISSHDDDDDGAGRGLVPEEARSPATVDGLLMALA